MSKAQLHSPPTFLTNVPKSILKALDPTEVLRYLTAAVDDQAAFEAMVALHEIQSYFDAAKHQQRRIERIKTATAKAMREKRRRRGESLFAVVHFYLICWARIKKLAGFVSSTLNRNASEWNVPKFKRIGLALRRYRKELRDRVDARDHYEHLEDRLHGGLKRHKAPVPSDLGNMINESLTFGGREVDIGPKSIRLLAEIVAEFRAAVLYDSLEALEIANKPCLARMLTKASRDVHNARTISRLKKTLSGSR